MTKKQAVSPEPETITTPSRGAMPLSRRALITVGLSVWTVAGFLLAGYAVGFAFGILQAVGVPIIGAVNTSVFDATVAALVYTLTLVIVVGLPLKAFGFRTTKEELGLARLPSWQDIFLTPASFVVYLLLSSTLLAATTRLFPGFDLEQVQDVGFDDVAQYYEYILAFITLVIIAPIAEEVLMRGYLYGKLRKVAPLVLAAIITSTLFAVLHRQWNVALDTFVLSMVMIALREMTGSIWAGTLLHMLKNGVAFYFLFVNPSFLNTIGV